jgi:hypothetical protein
MKPQSRNRIGLSALVAVCFLIGCGAKPAPSEDPAELFRGAPPRVAQECARRLSECDRLFWPGRRRDECIREVLRGECGRHALDAGRDVAPPVKDAAADVGASRHDAAVDHLDGHVDAGAADLRSVTFDGATNHCPVITTFNVPTTTVTVGESITISVGAFDPDPVDTLSYAWHPGFAIFVSFTPVQSSTTGTTVLTCIAAGSQLIDVSVMDGVPSPDNDRCAVVDQVTIDCVCPDGGCQPPACLPDQSGCGEVPCCSGPCNVTGICGGCVATGQLCGPGTPCCSDTCTNGSCGGGGCLPNNIPCSASPAPCCSGICNGIGICSASNCAADSTSCDDTLPCCNVLFSSCVGGICTPNVAPPCAQAGQACGGSTICCDGSLCVGFCH